MSGGIQGLDKAIRLNPDGANAYYSRGVAYKMQGKSVKAIAISEKYIGLTDNSQWADTARQHIRELSK